jgi:hypothetical protein
MTQPVLELLVERQLEVLREESPDTSAEQAMGMLVARYCGYNAAKILEVSTSALTEAEYREEAAEITAICERLISSLNDGTT